MRKHIPVASHGPSTRCSEWYQGTAPIATMATTYRQSLLHKMCHRKFPRHKGKQQQANVRAPGGIGCNRKGSLSLSITITTSMIHHYQYYQQHQHRHCHQQSCYISTITTTHCHYPSHHVIMVSPHPHYHQPCQISIITTAPWITMHLNHHPPHHH